MITYVLIIKDKKDGALNDTFYDTNLQKLKYKGMDMVAYDRKNITATIYDYENGKIGARACNCNMLLESYEGD